MESFLRTSDVLEGTVFLKELKRELGDSASSSDLREHGLSADCSHREWGLRQV